MTTLHIRLTGAVSILAGLFVFSGGMLHVILNRPFGHWLMLLGDILLIFAFTGLYAVQSRQTGIAGLLGYVLAILGMLTISAQDFIVLADTHGLKSAHEVWMFLYIDVSVILPGTFALQIGVLLLGLSTMYGRVLPRWAGLLLALAVLADLPAELLRGMGVMYALSIALLMCSLLWMGAYLLARSTRLAGHFQPLVPEVS